MLRLTEQVLLDIIHYCKVDKPLPEKCRSFLLKDKLQDKNWFWVSIRVHIDLGVK